MIAVDTSVAVAAFATWHERHGAAIRAVTRGARLPAHAALETLAVLTRLPPPHRAPADLVVRFLSASFPQPMLTLPAREHRALLETCARLGILGGNVYDALIAATAARAGATLLSLDVRARPVYEAIGVEVRVLGDG